MPSESTGRVNLAGLPYFARRAFIEFMDYPTYLFFTMHSEAVCDFLKREWPHRQQFFLLRLKKDVADLRLVLSDEHDFVVRISDMTNAPVEKKTSEFNGHTFHSVVESKYRVNTFWETKLTGIKCMVPWFEKIFDLNLRELFVDGIRFPVTDIDGVIDWLTEIPSLHATCEHLTEAQVHKIAANVKAKETFVMYQIRGRTLPLAINNYPSEVLHISRGRWVTPAHVLGTKCVKYTVHCCHLNNKGYNSILRGWMRGRMPNLRYLALHKWDRPVGFNNPERYMFKGVRYQKKKREDVKTWELRHRSEELGGGYELRRRDGAVARVFFKGQGRFHMYIWPADGQYIEL